MKGEDALRYGASRLSHAKGTMAGDKEHIYLNDSKTLVRAKLGLQAARNDKEFKAFQVA